MITVKNAQPNDYDVGFAELDSEHQVQIGLLITLQQAVAQGQDTKQVVDRLDQLLVYTSAHFSAEQTLMELYHYPYYDIHVSEHDYLINLLRTIQQGCQAGAMALNNMTISDLQKQLLNHIRGSDYRLGQYLSQQGVGQKPTRRNQWSGI